MRASRVQMGWPQPPLSPPCHPIASTTLQKEGAVYVLQPRSSCEDRAQMELGRAGGTSQPDRVPLSASTRHRPLTDAWGTIPLPLPHAPRGCSAASSHAGRTQIHWLQCFPTTHKRAEKMRDRQVGAWRKPLAMQDPSPTPVPVHTRHPRALCWGCRFQGRQIGPGPSADCQKAPWVSVPEHVGTKVTGKCHHCVATLTPAQSPSSPGVTARWLCSSPSPRRCQQPGLAVPWGGCGSASSPLGHPAASLPPAVGMERLCQDHLWVPWGEEKLQWWQWGAVVGEEVAIVLGQEQDAFGGSFDARQSFVGEMSSVYMWDTGISTAGGGGGGHAEQP